jgi:hypothetical protein
MSFRGSKLYVVLPLLTVTAYKTWWYSYNTDSLLAKLESEPKSKSLTILSHKKLTDSQFSQHIPTILSLVKSSDDDIVLNTLRFLNRATETNADCSILIKPVLDILIQTINSNIHKESAQYISRLCDNKSLHPALYQWKGVYSFMVTNRQNYDIVARIVAELYANGDLDRDIYPMETLDVVDNEIPFPTMLNLIIQHSTDRRAQHYASIGMIHASKKVDPKKHKFLEKRKLRDRQEFFAWRIGTCVGVGLVWVFGRYLVKYRHLLNSRIKLYLTIKDDLTYSSLLSMVFTGGMMASLWKPDIEIPVLTIATISQYALLSAGFSYIFMVPMVSYLLLWKMAQDFY